MQNTTEDTTQYIKNKSFDPTYQLSQVEAVGYDASAGVMRPIAVDAFGGIKTGTASRTVWIDVNRTDSYTEDGTLNRPYKTITAAVAAITTAGYTGATLNLTKGVYNETGPLTMPDIPLIIYGNNSYIAISGGMTFPNVVNSFYDINTWLNDLTFTSIATVGQTSFYNVNTIGNITTQNYLYFLNCGIMGGTLTIGNLSAGGRPASDIYNSGVNIHIVSQGQLIMDQSAFICTSAGAMVTSTAGTCVITNSLLYNSATGDGILCNNGADGFANWNILNNNTVVLTSGTYYINCGTAITYYGSNNVLGGTVAGTGLTAFDTNLMGPSKMQLGSDASGDTYYANATNDLTRLAIGGSGRVLTSNGTSPTWSGNINIGTDDITAGTLNLTDAGESTLTAIKFDAGTNTQAPITLQAGTSLATPKAGTIEFDGTDFFCTI